MKCAICKQELVDYPSRVPAAQPLGLKLPTWFHSIAGPICHTCNLKVKDSLPRPVFPDTLQPPRQEAPK